MSTESPSQEGGTKPSLVGRLSAPLRSSIGHAWAHPVRALTLLLLASIAVVGIPMSVVYWARPVGAPDPQRDVAACLRHLDAGEFQPARELAAELRGDDTIPYDQQGTSVFVLGACMANDASLQVNPRERQKLYLIAARYLQEARARGFPQGRQPWGLFLLGKSLFQAGRLAESVPLLEQLVATDSPYRADALAMLARAHLHEAKPRPDVARKYTQTLLNLGNLSPRQTDEARLLHGQVVLALDDRVTARKMAAAIAPESPSYADAVVLAARVQIAEADHVLATAAGDAVEAARIESARLYASALEQLRVAHVGDELGSEASRSAQLLLGVCYRRLGDLPAAETQFSRTRRIFFETDEGLIAGLEEADVQRQLDKHAEAVASYRRTLADAGSPDDYSNPWLSIVDFRRRVVAAHDAYLKNDRFTDALDIAKAMSPIFDRSTSVAVRADDYRTWAERLGEQASSSVNPQGSADQHYRNAARGYEQLAELRRATRHYPDDVWNSAESYFAGDDFRNAVRMLRLYLTTEQRRQRPQALVALGEAYLALNQLDASLKALRKCIEVYPRHPSSYQARLIASQVETERNHLPAAKSLLIDNLHHEGLATSSREWRDSLFALGNLLYREAMESEARSRTLGVNGNDADRRKQAIGELELANSLFQEAIVKLREATERFPQAPQAVMARYRLAEAHRKSALLPKKQLETVRIETIRANLNRQIQAHLGEAERRFDNLVRQLNTLQDTSNLGPVEKAILRNSYFARADALYDLGELEQAVQAYSSATNRFQSEPEALEAFLQVANCYRRLSRPDDARKTLERAKVVLGNIRSDAEFFKTTRYDRQRWERLLQWLSSL